MLNMAIIKTYIDLTEKEEKRVYQIKQICQEIIKNIDKITVKDNLSTDLDQILSNLRTNIELLNSIIKEINNLKSSLKSEININQGKSRN